MMGGRLLHGAVLAIAVALAALGVMLITAQAPTVVVKYVNGNIPLDPAAPVWPTPVEVPLTSHS